VTRIGELGTTQAATLMKEALDSSERSVLTRATRCNIPEDTILQNNLSSEDYNRISNCMINNYNQHPQPQRNWKVKFYSAALEIRHPKRGENNRSFEKLENEK
jgi:hypothetical protein